MIPYYGFIILLLAWLATKSATAKEARYFIDSSGKRLRSLNADFGIATTTATEIRSTDYIVKLAGSDSAENNSRVSIRSGICQIGNRTIPAADVKATLNGRDSVTLSEAKDGVHLIFVLKNPQQLEGPIMCEGFDIIIQ